MTTLRFDHQGINARYGLKNLPSDATLNYQRAVLRRLILFHQEKFHWPVTRAHVRVSTYWKKLLEMG